MHIPYAESDPEFDPDQSHQDCSRAWSASPSRQLLGSGASLRIVVWDFWECVEGAWDPAGTFADSRYFA